MKTFLAVLAAGLVLFGIYLGWLRVIQVGTGNSKGIPAEKV